MCEDKMAKPFVWFDAVGCGHEMQSFSSKPFLSKRMRTADASGSLKLSHARATSELYDVERGEDEHLAAPLQRRHLKEGKWVDRMLWS